MVVFERMVDVEVCISNDGEQRHRSTVMTRSTINNPIKYILQINILTTIGGRLRSHLVPSGPIGTNEGEKSVNHYSSLLLFLIYYICKDQDEPSLEVPFRPFEQELEFPWD